MKKLNSSSAGFSLVEIIVAVVILGIITVPLLHTLVTGARTARKSADAQDATNAAQSLVEQVRALGPDEVFKKPSTLSGAKLSSNYENKIKILNIDTYSVANRDYSAEVTIDASAADNSVALSKSNSMDITIDMKYADGKAKGAYQDACKKKELIYDKEEGDPDRKEIGHYFRYPNADNLKRSEIDISATRKHNDEGDYSYTVTVTFRYAADAYEDYSAYDYSVSSTAAVNVAKLPDYGDAAFSVYLIYDAYFKNGDAITIQNPNSDADYNVFLVNASQATMPGSFRLTVTYKGQRFSGDKTCLRVFSNLDKRYVTYTASDALVGGRSITLETSGELVEKTAEQRRYTVTVRLFEKGKSAELISLSSEMLI